MSAPLPTGTIAISNESSSSNISKPIVAVPATISGLDPSSIKISPVSIGLDNNSALDSSKSCPINSKRPPKLSINSTFFLSAPKGTPTVIGTPNSRQAYAIAAP